MTPKDAHLFAAKLIELESELHTLGLHETAKAINGASQKFGWEVAWKMGNQR